MPESDCCVRAIAHKTYWRFTKVNEGQTLVEVEAYTDPMGHLPAWLVNAIQKNWPRNSILSVAERASKPDIVAVVLFDAAEPDEAIIAENPPAAPDTSDTATVE